MLPGLVHVIQAGPCYPDWAMLPELVHVTWAGPCYPGWSMLPGLVHVTWAGPCYPDHDEPQSLKCLKIKMGFYFVNHLMVS